MNEDAIKLINVLYATPNVRTKEEITAAASALLRSPDNWVLNNLEGRIDRERLKHVITTQFPTHKEENEYKRIFAVVMSLVNGSNRIENVDLFGDVEIDKELVVSAGKAGKLPLYKLR